MVGLGGRRRCRRRGRRTEAVDKMRRDHAVALAVAGGLAVVVLSKRARAGGTLTQPPKHPITEADAIAFYADVLRALALPVTFNRMRFLTAWRAAEGGSATWNPFNTMWDGGSSGLFNPQGVKHYPTRAAGIHATASTLRLRYYVDLRERLQRDDPAELVAQSPSLSTWGTGQGVARVLASYPSVIPYRSPLYAAGVS